MHSRHGRRNEEADEVRWGNNNGVRYEEEGEKANERKMRKYFRRRYS